jgi:hypothetical protein
MTSKDIVLNAIYVIGQGKIYRLKVDDPQKTQRNIHKTLRRYKWHQYRVSIDGEYIVITRKK